MANEIVQHGAEIVAMLPRSGSLTKTGWTLPVGLTEQDWQGAGLALAKVEGAMSWWLGDWWAYGEHQYGERKALVESDAWEGPAFETCRNAASVCRAFETSRRRDVLSFTHHRECAGLPPEEADRVLDWAEETRASVKSTRERVKQVKAWLAQGWTQSQLDRKARVEQGLAVVASKREGGDGRMLDAALIAWADQQGLMAEIGRNTDWGNPFEMPKDGDRDTVCDNFARHYLPHKPSLLKRLDNLKGKVLVCWCHPERCHGDHLAEMANGQ